VKHVIFVLVGFSTHALAQDIFPAGSESKSAGLESVVATKSAPALFYNPANISAVGTVTGWQPYAEMGLIQAEYAYEHRDFDPVYVRVRSPIAAVGAVYSEAKQSWSAGMVIFPTKRGEIEIPGMPRRVGGETMPLQVKSQETAYKIAYGASKSFVRTRFGLSVVHGIEQKNITAHVVGAATPLLRQELDNRSVRVAAGLTHDIGLASIGISAISAATKKFDGNEQRATDPEALPAATIAYEPANFGVGLRLPLGTWARAELTANFRQWSKGAGVIRDGFTSQADQADIDDVIERGVLLGILLSKKLELTLSMAELPSPWGEGLAGGAAGDRIGPGFGQANLVDRRAIGGGVSGSMTETQSLALSFSNIYGSRDISEQGSSPGYYQTNVSLMTLGTTLKF
jgi:hypothetical protein